MQVFCLAACERLTGQQPAALRLPQVAQLSSSRGSVSARAGGSSRDADEQQGTSPGSSARVESHPVAVDGPLDDGWPADEVGSRHSRPAHVWPPLQVCVLAVCTCCCFAQVTALTYVTFLLFGACDRACRPLKRIHPSG